MSRQRVRDALAATAEDTPSARKARQALAAYEEWCEVNGQPAYPSADANADQAEQLLVRYLFSNTSTRGWRRGRFVEVSRFIASAFVEAGYPDPRGATWRGLREAVSRARPGTDAQMMDPFTEEEVLAAVEAVAVARCPHPVEVQGAAVLALADLLGWESNPNLQAFKAFGLRRDVFLVRTDDIVLTSGEGRRVLVDEKTQPHHYRVLATLLQRAGDAPYPVRDVAPHPGGPEQARTVLRRELQAALARADQTVARGRSSSLTTVPAWEAWWADADAAARDWLIANVEDRKLAQSRQDLAYFYTGLANASRHAELSRMVVGGWMHSWEGYYTRLAPDQHKGGLMALSRGTSAESMGIFVPHLDGGCEPHCPACRLSDHIEVRRRRHGAQDGEPLFVWPGRLYPNGDAQPLSATAGRELMNRLWTKLSAHLDPHDEGRKRRIGTRSIRVTAATTARLRGMSLQDVAELLQHKQTSTTVRYIALTAEHDETELLLREAAPER